MLEIWTIQISQWRKLPKDIEFIDITAKSGNPVFAPDKHNLWKYKNGEMSEEQYAKLYRIKMARTYRDFKDEWQALMGKSKIALACYCKADCFCHRLLLASYLEEGCKKLNIEYIRHGEYRHEMVKEVVTGNQQE